MTVVLTHLFKLLSFYPPFASIAKGEVFGLLYVCLFVCLFVNDFSTTRGPIHAKVRMRAYSGSGCVFSPFGGWRPPAGGKRGKRQMKFSLLWESMGNFLHFGGFLAISQQRVHGYTPNIICVRTMSADVPPPPVVPIDPWGAGEGESKTQKIGGWSHSCMGHLPFPFLWAMPNVVQYVGHRPAHILV